MRLPNPTRVLVIDASANGRRTITQLLERSPLVQVLGCASDGTEALRKTIDWSPDLVTLDLEMPGMDGVAYLRLVMSRCPTPVIVVNRPNRDEGVFKALELGAVDFITKPAGRGTDELANFEQELLRKVHASRQLQIEKVERRLRMLSPSIPVSALPAIPPELVAVGSSTGGPTALMQIFGSFLEAPPVAVLVSQHMPFGFTRGLAERLDRMTPFEAREAEPGDEPRPGRILVAPGGCHLELDGVNGHVVARLSERGAEDKYTPSVDRLFASAAKCYGPALLAVVLTGMGDDGRVGVQAVKQAGGTVIAESEETAVIYGMPQQAIRTGFVDAVLPLVDIPETLQSGIPQRCTREWVQEGVV